MATIADLNIRLGLLSKQFERDLRGMERRLQRSADKLSRIGSDLSTAISLPLAGIGFAAIKSAGDIEALRLALNSTMEDAGRSTEEAAAELEALRKAALAPGLDFEQAVKGSIRLQNVGFAAEDARGILEQLANAVALTGGSAQELDGVTRQFAQMISKGRILQEDLSIIQENMPAISKAMEQAFGTRSADQLRELGITAEDFIKGITQQFGELPRVSGGIKNSLVNLFVGLKLEAARLGEEINKAFNIGDAADGILKAVRSVVDAFAGLSDGTKRVVVGLAAVAVAAGPVIAILGRIVGIYGTVKTTVLAASGAFQLFAARAEVIRTVQASVQAGARGAAAATEGLSVAFAANTKAAEASRRAGRELAKATKGLSGPTLVAAQAYNGIVGTIQKATAAFNALNVAQRALVLGGVVAAIAGIVYVISELNTELTAAEKAQASVNEVTRKAAESIASEKVRAAELIGVLKDQNATRDEQQRALKALQAISPEHFRNLDLEKSKVGDIDKALDSYIDSLLRAAKAKQAFARLEEIERLRQTLYETAEPSIWDTLKNAVISAGNGINYAALQADTQAAKFVKLRDELDAEEKALRDVIKANGDYVEVARQAAGVPPPKAVDPEALKEASKQAELYRKALASIQAVADKGDVLGADVISEQAKEIENQIERLLENGFKPYSEEILHLRDMLKGLFDDIRVPQLEVGVSALPTIALPEQVLSIRAELNGVEGVKKGVKEIEELWKASVNAITEEERKAAAERLKSMQDWKDQWRGVLDNAFGAVQDILGSIGQIQQNNSQKQIAAIEEEYSKRIEAAKGNADQVAALQESLAQKKERIEKEAGRKAKAIAISTAIINVAEGVTKALATYPPPFNFIQAGLVAAAGALQIGTIQSQAFADGGVVYGPTLGLVGEYPGAATNPEIIAPESKLRAIFRDEMGGGDLKAIVRGDDLLFILDRAGTRRGRTR